MNMSGAPGGPNSTESSQTQQATQQPAAETTTQQTTAPAEAQTLVSQGEGAAQPNAGEAQPVTVDALTIPEGLTLEGEFGEKFLSIVNDDNLTRQQRANALLELQRDSQKAASETASARWGDLQTEWQKQVTEDPEVGGANLTTSLKNVSNTLAQFTTNDEELQKLKTAFDETGAGNRVEIVKFLARIGKAFGEGRPVGAKSAAEGPKDPAKVLFPSMN
jgi:hypothetical protein